MSAIRILRALVVTELILVIASFLGLFLPDDTPDAVSDYLNGPGAGPVLRLMQSESTMAAIVFGAITVAAIVVYAVCLVGLLRLKWWARRLYLALFVIGVCIYPFLGSSLLDPVSGTIDHLAAACSGAILVTLYVTDARSSFERTTLAPEQAREG